VNTLAFEWYQAVGWMCCAVPAFLAIVFLVVAALTGGVDIRIGNTSTKKDGAS